MWSLNKFTNIYLSQIDHFTVVGSVAWPMNGCEAASDLALTQSSLPYRVNYTVAIISLHYHKKSRKVSVKAGSPAASLPFLGRVT